MANTEDKKPSWTPKSILIIGGGVVLLLPVAVWLIVVATRTWACDGLVYCNFDQDGIATLWAALIALLGGGLAIVGALIVGLRQIDIQAKQAEILNRQTDIASHALQLETMKLRADLYERRVAIYSGATEFLRYILAYGGIPTVQNRDQTEEEKSLAQKIYNDFVESIGASKFLMSQSVADEMDRLWELAFDFQAKKWDLEQENIQDNREERVSNVRAAMTAIQDARNGLQTVFATDLQIRERRVA